MPSKFYNAMLTASCCFILIPMNNSKYKNEMESQDLQGIKN